MFAGIDFNPRLREGGDILQTQKKTSYIYFNPRLREGGDADQQGNISMLYDFNPRLREGGDAITVLVRCGNRISIHASAKEATSAEKQGRAVEHISIHASAKEATIM